MKDDSISQEITTWLEGPIDPFTKKEIESSLKSHPQKLEKAFSEKLSFGTGGIRALVGIGSSYLNPYTIARVTQGVANYLLQHPTKGRPLRVVIGYDNRKTSRPFAEVVAEVFSANGIEAYLFSTLKPTPVVSFACIYYHAKAAVMITASHNPPEYNGYKLYWEDGGQVVPPHDQGVIKEIEKLEMFSDVKRRKDPSLIQEIPENFDSIYLESLKTTSLRPKENQKEGKELKIIYTGLHGTGNEMTPKALASWGFSSVTLVPKESKVDPEFTYAPNPNPESKDALKNGSSLLLQKKADLLLANDPDADRIGLVVFHKDQAYHFSGNQIASMLLHYIFQNHKTLPDNAAFVKTIVTTELFSKICEKEKKACFDVLTGFKYIAQKIHEWEQTKEYTFIFGAEESLGYLLHSLTRDKDGVQACCLIAEMAFWCKEQGKDLYDYLLQIYEEYGVFRESQISIKYPQGQEGIRSMKNKMNALRRSPLSYLNQTKVCVWEDFLHKESIDLFTEQRSPLFLPKSDVLRFFLEDQTKIVIRPSGTEPKIKIYLAVQKEQGPVLSSMKECDQKLKSLEKLLKKEFE